MSSASNTGKNETRRSRSGCLICRAAKVKCSETRPVCQRCTKHGAYCEWPKPGPSLREIRRGHGPLKRRDAFTPKQLTPLPSHDSSVSNTRSTSGPVADSADGVLVGAAGHSLTQNREESIKDIRQSKPNETLSARSNGYLSNVIERSLSTHHISSSSSVILEASDHVAMHHYQTVLCDSSSFRNPKWLTFQVIFRYSNGNPAIMHLMLAASLAQMSHGVRRKHLWLEGKTHFQAGSQLLISGVNNVDIDHYRNVKGFWLLQFVFRTMWGPGAADSMKRLSKAIAKYMARHRILDLYSSPQQPSTNAQPTPTNYLSTLGRWDTIILSTFILWTMYEDVEAEFCQSGGYFASLLCSNEDVARNIFNAAQISLETLPGSGFRTEQAKNNAEYATALELRFQSTVMINRINKAATRWNSIEELSRIKDEMETILLKYSSVFELAQQDSCNNMPSVFMAKRMALHFYTTFTYGLLYLEAKQGTEYLTTERNVVVYNILSMIKYIIGSSSSVQSQWLEWPLLIIGIQVNDAVLQDWIRKQLVGCRYSFVINQVLRIKGNDTSIVLDIDNVRSICLNVS
ncbi:uncharacterized protein PAC_13472 [Phialocephala subalpina]|uniref:Zn(2)-C6 fungal-type domain-containing protein n=1 Tax=Phialocephala subalpina TaxID=576137 RepID=A0A1L7XEV7_9HELO|nr:uncharacterized protein PAC_13472 [Phialocephala subalpina]